MTDTERLVPPSSDEGFPNRYSGILHQYNQQIMEDCLPNYKELRDEAARAIIESYKQGDVILELGAGQGDSAEPLLKEADSRQMQVRLDLLDTSADMLRDAQERLKGLSSKHQLSFVERDAYQYLGEAQSYSTIFSQFTVHNFSRENKKKLFASVHHNLPLGGRFVLVDKVYPDDEVESERMLEQQRQLYKQKLPKEASDAIIAHEDEDFYNAELRTQESEIKAMLEQAGFNTSSIRVLKRFGRDIILEAIK